MAAAMARPSLINLGLHDAPMYSWREHGVNIRGDFDPAMMRLLFDSCRREQERIEMFLVTPISRIDA
ncbi:MAG TPA: hypothetical protein VEA16_06330 [Vicinamibacterales bacterium]|nr:hypothetical protein [Vicinamibacterales bacterium]